MAIRAASTPRFSPLATPMPMRAEPALRMMVRTSAKSRLMRPGTVMRSVMPCTPWRSTSSATLKASMMEVRFSTTWSRRSLGMMMRVSTFLASASMPASAWLARLRPSKLKGLVTTPTVRAPSSRADFGDDGSAAGTGAAPLARGDEHHVGALEDLADLVPALLGRCAAHLRIRAGAQSPGDLAADVELDVGVAHEERLRVGVDGDELDALEPGVHHAVDGVGTAAADTDDLDHRKIAGSRVAHSPRTSKIIKSQDSNLSLCAKPSISYSTVRLTHVYSVSTRRSRSFLLKGTISLSFGLDSHPVRPALASTYSRVFPSLKYFWMISAATIIFCLRSVGSPKRSSVPPCQVHHHVAAGRHRDLLHRRAVSRRPPTSAEGARPGKAATTIKGAVAAGFTGEPFGRHDERQR